MNENHYTSSLAIRLLFFLNRIVYRSCDVIAFSFWTFDLCFFFVYEHHFSVFFIIYSCVFKVAKTLLHLRDGVQESP